ncbi:MAG: 50S ribosome-binding GTPase [Candidatus Lokiarchaeota archaeon]|nr:50S ribosome-binding GTPase [Candidatus Lokiarchaeota archaeon]
MDKLIESSIIKGLLFSAFDKFGPQPIYMFPDSVDEDQLKKAHSDDEEENNLGITLRDYTQIAIKNITLLLGDGNILHQDHNVLKKYKHFGIMPFPDFGLTSLSYFHFIDAEFSEIPLASAFCILIDEKKRSFLYNNINRLKNIITDFFSEFDNRITKELLPQELVAGDFKKLLEKIINIEQTPSTPITTQRKMKIILSGLDNSGKTSFIISVDRKFSKLIGLKPTRGADVSSIEALGTTIFLWDLGGQRSYQEGYLNKSQIYLFEADLLFYFIDIRDKERFNESIEYLKKIRTALKNLEQKTPIIYIFSKGDPDIINSVEIQSNIKNIKKKLTNLSSNGSPEIYVTTVFEIFSILRGFSSGIAKLSPNRNLIEYNLSEFSSLTGSSLVLLLSSDGLVLAEHFTPEAMEITKMQKSEELLNVFEVVAPQFTTLFKIFYKFKTSEKEEAIFRVSDSVILLKRVKIVNYELYILFLINNESKKDIINQNLQDFLNRTQDLLLRYIS